MCDTRDRSGSFLVGVTIGAAIGAGLTFLFGTKKGKEVREEVRDRFPEVFERLDDLLEGLRERYEEVAEEVEDMEEGSQSAVKEKVAQIGAAVEDLGRKLESVAPRSKRFRRSGHKL